ncbi:hypothetical protein DL93DRAFT_2173606 [Clavulina sp. PMI_390]|nr:hypothetical protein DL93DRAFT_2173606 [Clavulina sp. PMI_390]
MPIGYWVSLLPLLCVFCTLRIWSLIVQDTDSPGITFDSTWVLDPNPANSGGFAHRTNYTGGTASLVFYGSDISMYGVTHSDGAHFTFTVDGTITKQCTCHVNDDTWTLETLLCEIGNLSLSEPHTVVIKHDDVDGLWVTLDLLQIINSTATTTSTTSSSTSSSASSPTNSSSSHSRHTAAIAGGAAGGLAVLILVIVALIVVLRRRSKEDPALYGPTRGIYATSLYPPTDGTQSMHAPSPAVNENPSQPLGPSSSARYGGYLGYSEPYSALPTMHEIVTHPQNLHDPGTVPAFPVYTRVDRAPESR